MLNKRWITLPVVYCRPFASKAVFLSDLSVLEMYSHNFLDNFSNDFEIWDKPIITNNFYLYILIQLHIYVIHRLGGPYWEKLCPRSWVRPWAVLRPRAQFLPIRTDLGRWITFLFFSYWDLKVSGKFYFSLQPMCVEEGRVRVDVIQSARSIANQNKTLQHDFNL